LDAGTLTYPTTIRNGFTQAFFSIGAGIGFVVV
jgi:hypothetical protein